MSIYYNSPLATLYLGDANEVIPTLARDSIDLLVTDPPYGVDWQSGLRGKPFDKIEGDDGSLDVLALLGASTQPLRNCRHVYVFGYSPDQLRDPMRLGGTTELIWDKGQPGPGDLSLPWAPSHERITFGVHVRSAANRSRGDGALAARLRTESVLRFPRKNSRGVASHPTEKPVGLMRTLIESSSVPGDTVFDPFAGSGSTLVAAVSLGRRAVGVELVEEYAEIAAKRLQAAEILAGELAAL